MALVIKKPPANSGDIREARLNPVSGRTAGREHNNPLQYSCLENPMDRIAWQATVHRITQCWTQRKTSDAAMHACMLTTEIREEVESYRI